ncbi:NAD(P)-dependent glycerol-3-phosphate dehydrogenase [Canibacter sp. lx-72]|uniref:NAD(P)H-dependent glycerol-3-phosphate dehydrogenase n=1 Tax=Canibacter zhuwentaonis TaxID=2837491 RepID=UPI001BDCCC64|nr:NAD(P)H-dependent glycerol-3-phosphate dehydrogenase [Canibacter zhuwentaonis]MBT1018183.1 NAD(P)-dependent glycerol-3-phosphate dehydrogenase [Canibacter zhuwentaonis]MBT1035194.1 NAD(P)-dependent glycerol-3-phosphate dehydrogenase [Canibacter zhuwentaonis]
MRTDKKQRTQVAVIGAGSFGTTYAKILCDAGNDVVLWARRGAVVKEINKAHRNSQYLPEIVLPKQLRAVDDLATAVADAEIVFLAIPSNSLRDKLLAMASYLRADAVLVSLMKGVEKSTGMRMSQVITETINWSVEQVAVVSGPNIALEIAREQPTGAVASCVELAVAKKVAQVSTTPYFRTYINTDVTGTELGGVLKNLIAIAIGIVDGVGYGENTKASIITRGIAEMTEFAVASGAYPTTMTGLAGLGDLITTCQSPLSRNFSAGRLIGQRYSKEQTAAKLGQLAEGLTSVDPVLRLAAQRGIEMPIVSQVKMVLDGDIQPLELGPHLAAEGSVPEPELKLDANAESEGIWHKTKSLFRKQSDGDEQ